MVEFMNFVQTVNPYKYPEDNYLPKFWHLFFKCSFSKFDCQLLENCQPNASLELLPRYLFDPVMSEESYNIYNAVYAVAYSLHEMNLQQIQIQRYANGEKMVAFPWEVMSFNECSYVYNETFLLFPKPLKLCILNLRTLSILSGLNTYFPVLRSMQNPK